MNKLTRLFQLKGGETSPVLLIVIIVIAIILVILLIRLCFYLYYRNNSESGDCSSNRGCLLLSEVKHGKKPYTIKSYKFPPSNPGNGYSLTTWLFVKNNNFSNKLQNFKTIICRGAEKKYNNFKDEQYSVQPGIWLYGNTNKILLRWDTLGRISSIINCDDIKKPCTKGDRCRVKETDEVKLCNKDGKLVEEDTSVHSMNPYINPPSKLCSGPLTGGEILWNTSDVNMDNETCIDNIPIDRWFQLAIVMHNQSVDIYIDGKVYSTFALNSMPVNSSDSNLMISKDNSPYYSKLNGFQGGISQLRYFDRPLTPYEIMRIYSWGPQPFVHENTNIGNPKNEKKKDEKPNEDEKLGSDNY